MFKPYTTQDVRDASSKALFTFADFFAGGGGSSTGIKLAGGKEIFMNEFVEEACRTFSANYPDVIVFPGDIKELTAEEILAKTGLKKGEIDLISGSPPCSAFSISGKREKNWGKDKNYSDGKKVSNIEDLFFEFLRMIDGIRPKVVIAENVRGLTIGEAQKYLARIINEFSSIGYEATFKVMFASDHGVPQTRSRCIFIAVRNDVMEALDMSMFSLQGLYPEDSGDNNVTVGEAIGDMENDPQEVEDLIAHAARTYLGPLVARLPKNSTKTSSPSDEEHKSWNPKGSYFNMIRCSAHLPSPTLTQMGQKKAACGVFHYNEDRKFTIKELTKLMSLPEDFNLTGSFDQKAERICRMVAPIMMKAVAESLYEKVIKPFNESKK